VWQFLHSKNALIFCSLLEEFKTMKIRRICKNCGTTWYPAGLGITSLRTIRNLILIFGTPRGPSAVDLVALQNRDEKKDTTCPNCNYNVYYQEEVAEQPKGQKDKPMTSGEKKGCIGCLFVLGVVGVIGGIVENCMENREKEGNDDAIFKTANSLMQNQNYELVLKVLDSISIGYKKQDEVKKLKHKADSLLSEKNYELGKKLFEEKKFIEALPTLAKVSNKHKNYKEARDMAEVAEALTKVFLLNLFIKEATLSVSSGEFQLRLKSSGVVAFKDFLVAFTTMAKQIKECEGVQNYEFKYLNPDRGDDLKKELKRLTDLARKKMVNYQQKEFPLLRKEFAKTISDNITSIAGIKTEAKGNGNSRLEFTHKAFTDKENIEIIQKLLIDSGMIDSIKNFRFKVIAYKRYKYDEEYTYYEYNTPADGAIISEPIK